MRYNIFIFWSSFGDEVEYMQDTPEPATYQEDL